MTTNLEKIENEKQAENASISLSYLSAPENAKAILQGDTEVLRLA